LARSAILFITCRSVETPAGLLKLRMTGRTGGNNIFTFWIYLLGNFSKQEENIHHHHPPPSNE